MVSRPVVVKAEIGGGGSGKPDYRNSCQCVSVCLHQRFLFQNYRKAIDHSTSPVRVRRASGRGRDVFSAAVWPGAAALADRGPVVAVSLEEGGAREVPGP